MRALHLPGVPDGSTPPFRFPDSPPKPADLDYTTADFPEPRPPPSPKATTPSYLLRVLTTALTRGELTWAEILEPSRFHAYGSAIPGHDVVGIVEKVFRVEGNETEASPPKYFPGDKVWALLDFDRDGAAATYTIALEHELSLVPAIPPHITNISPSQWNAVLATIPLSGLTGYQALFSHGHLPPSSLSTPDPRPSPQPRVLITGASGSVGAPTLQLAKAAGFHVTAVCSSTSLPFVTDTLHADAVIDYTSESFTSIPDAFASRALAPVNLVIDCTGSALLQPILSSPASMLVRNAGRIVTVVAPLAVIAGSETQAAANQAALDEAGVAADFFIVKPDGVELRVLGRLVEEGRLRGLVDEVFALEDGRDAMQVVESRGRRGGGKVVLRVAEE
ncbi:hypothetical protein LTR84_005385 [Exophiala bonariae]|uniref:Enoyl reductase (ER) domain-containing protein n=1 Tax=Exophiala bonariae TaxID=1690606 RepID=A0AAV9N401_9EURO|nr:hypothetical protein LTR84_005385 [Exophiala bonariae]